MLELLPLRLHFPRAAQWFRVIEEGPDGMLSFARSGTERGVLQITMTEYTGGEEPNPAPKDLVQLASEVAKGQGLRVLRTDSGSCPAGVFGRALCESPDVRCFQIWYLSNGRDFLLATYIAEDPDAAETEEAEKLIRGITWRAKRRWWKWR